MLPRSVEVEASGHHCEVMMMCPPTFIPGTEDLGGQARAKGHCLLPFFIGAARAILSPRSSQKR